MEVANINVADLWCCDRNDFGRVTAVGGLIAYPILQPGWMVLILHTAVRHRSASATFCDEPRCFSWRKSCAASASNQSRNVTIFGTFDVAFGQTIQ